MKRKYKRRPRDSIISFFTPRVPKRVLDLNWKEAKKRFPLMNPYTDFDRDGIPNYKDCKPFDIKRQGKEHKKKDYEDIAIGFDAIAKLKTIGDVKKLEEEYLKKRRENE